MLCVEWFGPVNSPSAPQLLLWGRSVSVSVGQELLEPADSAQSGCLLCSFSAPDLKSSMTETNTSRLMPPACGVTPPMCPNLFESHAMFMYFSSGT